MTPEMYQTARQALIEQYKRDLQALDRLRAALEGDAGSAPGGNYAPEAARQIAAKPKPGQKKIRRQYTANPVIPPGDFLRAMQSFGEGSFTTAELSMQLRRAGFACRDRSVAARLRDLVMDGVVRVARHHPSGHFAAYALACQQQEQRPDEQNEAIL